MVRTDHLLSDDHRDQPFEHIEHVLKNIHRPRHKIPNIGMFGHDPQRQLFTAAANDQGWMGFLYRFWFAAGILELVVAAVKGGQFLCK